MIPIAGDFTHTLGGSLDPKWTRLKTSSASADREKEGLRLEMGGGKYDGEPQKAVVELLCDRSSEERPRAISKEDDELEGGHENKEAEETDDGKGGILKFLSYEMVGDTKVLSLEWHTKYACEDAKDGSRDGGGGHWGFFTWFIIMWVSNRLPRSGLIMCFESSQY